MSLKACYVLYMTGKYVEIIIIFFVDVKYENNFNYI